MPATILVPLDGSELAERALPVAERLARAANARLLIVRVLNSADQEPDATAPDVWAQGYLAEDYVGHAAEMARRAAGVDTHSLVVYGATTDSILEAVRQHAPSLVVMATHGRSGLGRWLYGSTTDEVLRSLDIPVMVIPFANPALVAARGRAHRILLALDGSERSLLLLQPVRQLAIELQAEIVLARLVEEPPMATARMAAHPPVLGDRGMDQQVAVARDQVEGVAQQLRSTVRGVSVRCEPGDPARRIVEIADEEGADLIALVTRGRVGLRRLFLGSVATSTLRRTRVPVLLLRAAASEPMPNEIPTLGSEPQASEGEAEPSGVLLQLPRSDVGLMLEGLNALRLSERLMASEAQAIDELEHRLKRISETTAEVANPA
jgi:nucleotide-binding universal stress UspA family protein